MLQFYNNTIQAQQLLQSCHSNAAILPQQCCNSATALLQHPYGNPMMPIPQTFNSFLPQLFTSYSNLEVTLARQSSDSTLSLGCSGSGGGNALGLGYWRGNPKQL
jgi:hypothetical protein